MAQSRSVNGGTGRKKVPGAGQLLPKANATLGATDTSVPFLTGVAAGRLFPVNLQPNMFNVVVP